MPTQTHLHTYVKYWPNKWKNKFLYKCDDPYCRHYEERSMLVNKAALCTKCHREFILTMDALKRVRPTCVGCSDTKAGRELRAVRDLLASLEPPPLADDVKPSEFPDPMGGLD